MIQFHGDLKEKMNRQMGRGRKKSVESETDTLTHAYLTYFANGGVAFNKNNNVLYHLVKLV